MVCYKCGQELKEGVKFCTNCGVKPKVTVFCAKCGSDSAERIKLTLPIISIVVSAIGIIVYWVIPNRLWCDWIRLLDNLIRGRDLHYDFFYYQLAEYIQSVILPTVGILMALVAQHKQKSVLGFIAGLIPCVHSLIMVIYFYMKWVLRG